MLDYENIFSTYLHAETRKYLRAKPAPIKKIRSFKDTGWRICCVIARDDVAYYLSSELNAGRIVQRLPTIHAFVSLLRQRKIFGELTASIGDKPSFSEPCVSFSSSQPYNYLIPDPYFCRRDAYEDAKINIAANWVSVADREPVLFWRGSFTGDLARKDGRFRTVYELNRLETPGIDVKFAASRDRLQTFLNRENSLLGETEKFEGDNAVFDKMLGERTEFIDFIKRRFQLDVDGNSNAWDSMFKKMLLGGPVFKIGHAFKQWYYDRLIEEDVVIWRTSANDIHTCFFKIRDDVALAEEIGERARRFADRLTVRGELERCANAFPKRGLSLYQFPDKIKLAMHEAHNLDEKALFKNVGDIRSLSDNLNRHAFRLEATNVFARSFEMFDFSEQENEEMEAHLSRLKAGL